MERRCGARVLGAHFFLRSFLMKRRAVRSFVLGDLLLMTLLLVPHFVQDARRVVLRF